MGVVMGSEMSVAECTNGAMAEILDAWYQRVEAAGVFMSSDVALALLDDAPPMADVSILSALIVSSLGAS